MQTPSYAVVLLPELEPPKAPLKPYASMTNAHAVLSRLPQVTTGRASHFLSAAFTLQPAHCASFGAASKVLSLHFS
jgi:hypothetical protein